MNAQAPQPDFFREDSYEKFVSFHRENPQVWREFETRALEMIRAGRKHYSARAIMEVARWSIHLQTTGDDFKINNNHVPFYARLFREVHPDHQEFFRTREQSE